MDAHGREVARLLRKLRHRMFLLAAVTLGVSTLLPLPLYLRYREPVVLYMGAILEVIMLLAVVFFYFDRERPVRKVLEASLGEPPKVAFHGKGGYVFINAQGVFSERTFTFNSYWGLSAIRALEFDAEARRLTIGIRNFRNRDTELRIDVPAEVPIEQLSAVVREGQQTAIKVAERSASMTPSRPAEDRTQHRAPGRRRRRK